MGEVVAGSLGSGQLIVPFVGVLKARVAAFVGRLVVLLLLPGRRVQRLFVSSTLLLGFLWPLSSFLIFRFCVALGLALTCCVSCDLDGVEHPIGPFLGAYSNLGWRLLIVEVCGQQKS